MSKMKVITCDSYFKIRRFIELQYKIYKGDPNFVPPLRLMIRQTLTGKNNMLLANGPHELLLLRKDGKDTARLLVGIDEKLNEQKGKRQAYISMFECVEGEVEAALKILKAAELWAADHGCDQLFGPVSPSGGDDFRGLLIKGYDGPPAMMNNYNHPWYVDVFTKFGFAKKRDLIGYDIPSDVVPTDKLEKLIPYAMKKYDYRVDRLNLKDMDKEIKDIQQLIAEAIPDRWDNQPIPSVEDIKKEANSLLPLIDADLIYIARANKTNRPIGLVVALPEYNQVLKHLGGRLFPIGIFKFLFYKRKITAVRIFIQMVIPEYQRKGVNAAIFFAMMNAAEKKGIVRGDGSAIGEDNIASKNSVERIGGKVYRIFRQYEKKIAAS